MILLQKKSNVIYSDTLGGRRVTGEKGVQEKGSQDPLTPPRTRLWVDIINIKININVASSWKS